MRVATTLVLLFACSCAGSVPPATSASAPSAPHAPVTGSAVASAPPATEAPPASAPVDPRVARLARLARIWGDIQYVHPYLWENRSIDWDAALSTAIPKVSRATSDDDEAVAVQAMLSALGDPVTRVRDAHKRAPGGARGETSMTWPSPGVLVVKLALDSWSEIDERVSLVRSELAKAKYVVVDLRASNDDTAMLAARVVEHLASSLAVHASAAPASRAILHSGYVTQDGDSSGGYSTSFVSGAPQTYPAATGPHPARTVFLANERSNVPSLAFAMQRAGDAEIISQGMNDPAEWTSDEDPVGAGGEEGKVAQFRVDELDGTVAADVVLPASPDVTGGPALDAAIELVRHGWKARAAAQASPLRPARWKRDATYPEEAYPPLEHRLLALFRFWNVIRLFYPYQQLMEAGSWERALTELIPRLEQTKDAREYALTLGELAARVPDSHVKVDAKELQEFLGRPVYGITIRDVEGKPLITKVESAEKAAGARVGDVVVSVDGEPVEARRARVRPYIPSSNAWTLARDTNRYATGGAKDSEAVLLVRGADETEREVRVKRRPWAEPAHTAKPHYKTIDDGSVGYVDLAELRTDEVDPMFVALAKTRAIVFDMRGYPNATAWSLAPHLNTRATSNGPLFSRMLVGPGGEERQSRFQFVQWLPNDEKPKYTGKTVMLVNEETQSQAEHTGLFLEAANGTKFIGSPTAGANGDTTNTCLPGGICIRFSGHDVRHADGRQLQRVGIQPDVEVRPTIAGIRAGRDEVLERALGYLREGR